MKAVVKRRRRLTPGLRYQVLHVGKPTVENFSTKREAMARINTLKTEGVKATFWDTLNNSLSDLFRF